MQLPRTLHSAALGGRGGSHWYPCPLTVLLSTCSCALEGLLVLSGTLYGFRRHSTGNHWVSEPERKVCSSGAVTRRAFLPQLFSQARVHHYRMDVLIPHSCSFLSVPPQKLISTSFFPCSLSLSLLSCSTNTHTRDVQMEDFSISTGNHCPCGPACDSCKSHLKFQMIFVKHKLKLFMQAK